MKAFLLILRISALALAIYVKARYTEWLPGIAPYKSEADLLLGFLVFFLSANSMVALLSLIYRRRKHYKDNQGDNVVLGLKNIYYILMSGAVVTTIIGLFGVEPRALFTTLSILAAAIAIVSKEYISEIISGIIISFSSNEISVGDYLKIGSHKG